MTCTATAVTLGRPCRRPAKYEFIGHERREARCGTHAYEWLGSPRMPSWITEVTMRGKPVPVR